MHPHLKTPLITHTTADLKEKSKNKKYNVFISKRDFYQLFAAKKKNSAETTTHAYYNSSDLTVLAAIKQAVLYSDKEIIQKIYDKGFCLPQSSWPAKYQMYSPLIIALTERDPALASQLLSSGVSAVSPTYLNLTYPLLLAAGLRKHNDQIKLMNLLLSKGAKLTDVDRDGHDIFHHARSYQVFEFIFQQLPEQWPDFNFHNIQKEGRHLFYWATRKEFYDPAQYQGLSELFLTMAKTVEDIEIFQNNMAPFESAPQNSVYFKAENSTCEEILAAIERRKIKILLEQTLIHLPEHSTNAASKRHKL